jgi:uncharacterized integral membrane protein (TIGR02327 family)
MTDGLLTFVLRAGIYILSFVVVFYAMQSVNYEKLLKAGHVRQAQVLYFLIIIALSYLVGSFFNVFLYR